jgi:uncharacterized protein YdiU (UPF0061 family)
MEVAAKTAAEPEALSATLPAGWPNRLESLGERFFTRLGAEPLPEPRWVVRSPECAKDLGFPSDWWQRPDWNALAVFSGNATWPRMQPLASVYSGHQFGVWAGQLGDGRALWLGEVDAPAGAMELQLKGAGRTPYSRMGDGRAVLRSSIREFLCSEAMHALGIATTRALCVTGSCLPVLRESVETAAVLTRVAPSFLRFGHFEHFASRGEIDALRTLADFVIDHHEPDCRERDDPYAALFERVAERTADLMAAWQSVGFCHGVMNTDNLSILGLTIDYGPFGFLDAFDPGHICNHSDTQGRYAWARQPQIGLWNLHALGHAMRGLVADEGTVHAALQSYPPRFAGSMVARFAAKLGLDTPQDGDGELIDDLLRLMATARADFTITFRRLCDFDSSATATNDPVRDLFVDRAAFDAWAARYAARLRRNAIPDAGRSLRMRGVNPRYVLRNHLAEAAIRAAEGGDFSETERLRAILQRPFDEQPEAVAYGEFPPDWAKHLEVSCSS